MDLNKLNKFCDEFGLDKDNLDVYPGWKREIFLCLSEDEWERIVPQEEAYNSYEEFESALDKFYDTWWYIGDPGNSLNIY